MGMVGNDMGQVHAVPDGAGHPKFAEGASNGGGVAGDAMGWALAWRWARCWRKTCSKACRAAAAQAAPLQRPRWACGPTKSWPRWRSWPTSRPRASLTQEEFDTKKAELLKKLV